MTKSTYIGTCKRCCKQYTTTYINSQTCEKCVKKRKKRMSSGTKKGINKMMKEKPPNHVCGHCGIDFYYPQTKKKYCSDQCRIDHRKGIVRGFSGIFFGKKNKNNEKVEKPIKINKKGFYVSNKDSYKNKLINYDAPFGKGYIGISKRPLMENKEFKHGYQGVLMQDETRQFIQCNSCGKWFRKITTNHIKSCSGLTMDEYKEKSGYHSGQGLVSDETSLTLTKSALKNKTIKNINSKARFTKRAYDKSRKRNLKTRSSMQWKNKHGTCPEQLKTRTKEFVICNRELPTSQNRGGMLYKHLRNEFGTVQEAFKQYGLPTFKRQGTNYKYTFPDYTVFKYNINQMDGREALYNMMIQKCPILST